MQDYLEALEHSRPQIMQVALRVRRDAWAADVLAWIDRNYEVYSPQHVRGSTIYLRR
jgi:hypothetical protein